MLEKPDYPLLTRVRVSWPGLKPGIGVACGTGRVVSDKFRWTGWSWEVRVRLDIREVRDVWIPAERVTPISAVDLLGNLLGDNGG